MSKLTDNDMVALNSLRWETQPADFDRLCEFIISLLAERDGLTRQRLFGLIPEQAFREEVRSSAGQRRGEAGWKMAAHVYVRMKFSVLPGLARKMEDGEQ